MGATFLMSYPRADWQRSGRPRAAISEWLTLCDAITRAGGRILVMPPPATGEPALPEMIRTANAGALFKQGDRFRFVVSKMSAAERQPERERVLAFWQEAGVPTEAAQHVWEGQADVTTLAGSRFLLTWGVRSVRESVAETLTRLPPGARTLEVRLREPFSHGDTCLNPLVNRGGDTVLLAHGGALVDRTLPELRSFVGNYAEVFAVDAEDALAHACGALCVDGTVLLPAGLSTGLRGQLVRRGFSLEELELPELLGTRGGGPRHLVNELRGLVLTDDAPSYTARREQLHALAETYPETAG